MSNTTSFLVTPCPPLEIYFFSFVHDNAYKSFMIAMIVINGIIALLSFGSNFFVIYTIAFTKSLQTPSNILILGLAVSDFGVALVSQPSFCAVRASELQHDVSQFCSYGQVFQGSIWMLAVVSFCTYTAITADRYIAIQLHLRYKEIITTRKIALVLVLLWMFCSVVPAFRFSLMSQAIVITGTVLFISFILLNIYFIVSIALVIRRHSVQIYNQQQTTQDNMSMPRYKRSVNTVYYVIGVYILCYVPFMLTLLIQGIMGQSEYQKSKTLFCIQVLAITLVMSNSAFNPIIYYWRIRDLRTGTLRLLRTMWLRCKSTERHTREPTVRLSSTRQRH